MGKGKTKKKSEDLSLKQQMLSNTLLESDIQRQNAIFQQIKPLADFLLAVGIDPIKFLSTPQGAALLAPQRAAIGTGFDQARTNLVDMLAGTGFSPGGGQGVGPLANLFGQEATAQSDLLYKTIADSLNLGLQGANVLSGQQAIFDPFRAGAIGSEAAKNIESSKIGLALIGAAGSALGGLSGNPAVFGKKGG